METSLFGKFVLLAGIFLVGINASPSILLDESVNLNIPKSIAYLGTVEGKSFFAEMTPVRNWTAAGSFCESSGKQLGRITTQTQAKFLVSVANNVTFDGHFWTAGRDAGTHQQYTWGSTNVSVNASAVPYIFSYGIITCLNYHTPPGAGDTTFGDYHAAFCNQTFGTLCEVYHGRKE